MRPEEELHALSRAACPPLEEALDERALVRCVARRVPRDHHEPPAGVEPVPAQELLVVGVRSPPVEEIGLRPPGDAHAVRLDPVVAAQVVLHDAVLDDVEIAVGGDDALPDRVVPARDVRDDREPQATRRGEERHRARGLDVREDEAAAVPPHRLEQPSRDVPPRAEEPPLHRSLDRRPARKRAVTVGVEHPVRVAGVHPLGMEPVPAVQPHREWVVAEPAVEPGVDPAQGSVGNAARSGELVAVQHLDVLQPADPLRCAVAGQEEHRGEVPAEPLAETAHDPRVYEDSNGELIGEDDPGPLRAHVAGTPTREAIRVASDAPSRAWTRSASTGVPHAGQPSTPKTVTARPGRVRRRPSPRAPTGA